MSKQTKTRWASRVKIEPVPDHLSHIAWTYDSNTMPTSVIRKFLYSQGNYEQGMDRDDMIFFLAFLYRSDWMALKEDLREWELERKAKIAKMPESFKKLINLKEEEEITFEEDIQN